VRTEGVLAKYTQAQAAKGHGAKFCAGVRQALRRVTLATYGLIMEGGGK
jgi:hypothetical protein